MKISWVDFEPMQKEIETEIVNKFSELYHNKIYIGGPQLAKFEHDLPPTVGPNTVSDVEMV